MTMVAKMRMRVPRREKEKWRRKGSTQKKGFHVMIFDRLFI